MTDPAARWFRLACIGSLCLLSACGGGGGADKSTGTPTAPQTPTPPTPPATNVPASVAIVAGDAQSGETGTRLPIALSVLVRNSAGTPVAGVAVEFSIDSGGGSLSSSTATTTAEGIATSGTWTLGAVGNNVVIARVASLPVVRFRSIAQGPAVRTLIERTMVPVGGGTITYRKPGDPLDGLTVTIPAQSYATATSWTITADSVTRPTLPDGFAQVGPTLTVDNGSAHADSVLSLTMPTNAGADDAVAPFYFDAATGYLEPIPIVERSAGAVGLATRHFARDLLALPGVDPGVSAARHSLIGRAALGGFGAVKVVWIKTPRAQLAGTFSSGFMVGRDNWEFVNRGHFASPRGSCEGMSITALHYWYFVKRNGAPPLYHRFDKSLTDLLDNVQGERYAAAVQADYLAYAAAHGDQVVKLIAQATQRGTRLEELTPSWIVLTLKLLKQPVLIGLSAANAGHAVIATAATYDPGTAVTTVTFIDPNVPTQARTMRFQGGTLTPFSLATKANVPPITITGAYALAVSAEVPLADISRRWAEFQQQRAGADLYPATYRLEYRNDLTESWERLPDTVRTTAEVLALRHICPSCKAPTTGGAANEHPLTIWDGGGTETLGRNTIGNSPGLTRYYAELEAFTNVDHALSAPLDARVFTVLYSPVEVITPDTNATVGTTETWRVNAGALAGAGVTYTWRWDDGTPDVTTSATTLAFTPKRPGVTIVTLLMKDAKGTLVARVVTRRLAKVALALAPAAGVISRNVPVTFTVTAVGFPLSSLPRLHFLWIAQGPGGAMEEESSQPTLTHTFTGSGSTNVSVYAYVVNEAGDDIPIGKVLDQEYLVSDILPTWKFTSFTVEVDKSGPNPWLTNPSIGSTTHFTRPEQLWSEIQSGAKRGGILFLERDSTFGTRNRTPTLKRRGIYFVDTDQPLLSADDVARYLDVPPAGTTFNTSGSPQVRANWFANPVAPFRAADAGDLSESYALTGTIAGGSLISTVWNWQFSTFKGNGLTLWFPFETRQINVTFNGTTATGTVTVISRDFDHSLEVLPRPETKRWTITARFTAERVR
ncbi:hypothetical protein [Gemmatimonas aurantiaca]|uniref:hypothetical protein n=1 Tax=Gemmatimonas aurantiaca TaxID=173480 RepID=UPI00301C2335